MIHVIEKSEAIGKQVFRTPSFSEAEEFILGSGLPDAPAAVAAMFAESDENPGWSDLYVLIDTRGSYDFEVIAF